jgi:hypothetical protein
MIKTQPHSSSFLFISPQMAFPVPAQYETSVSLVVSFHKVLQPKSFNDSYMSDFKL